MSTPQRVGLIAVALVVAVGAFLLLKGSDDDDSTDKAGTTAQTTTAPTSSTTTTQTTLQPPPEKPKVPVITVKAGKPVGGELELELQKGDVLAFTVKSDEAHEIHLHGYDIEKGVEAGGQVKFNLEATIEGVFEVEIEDLKVPIAEVKVTP